MNLSSMTDSQKFILLAICFLIPVGLILLNWILYFIGKFFWDWYLPKLRRNSKLRFRVTEEIKQNNGFLLYVETGATICFMLFSIFWLLL